MLSIQNKNSGSNLLQVFKMAFANAENQGPGASGNCSTVTQIVAENYYPCFSDSGVEYYVKAAYACQGNGPGTCMHGWFETTYYCDGTYSDNDYLNTNATCGS